MLTAGSGSTSGWACVTSLTLIPSIGSILGHLLGPGVGSSSTGNCASAPRSPWSPNAGTGVGVKSVLLCSHFVLFFFQMTVFSCCLLILCSNVIPQCFVQTSDIFVVLMVQDLFNLLQLLSFLLPTKANLEMIKSLVSVFHILLLASRVESHCHMVVLKTKKRLFSEHKTLPCNICQLKIN